MSERSRPGILQLAALLAWIPVIVAIVQMGESGEPALGLLLGFLVTGCIVWATVDWILLVCKAFTDGQGRRMTKWFQTDANVTSGGAYAPPPPAPTQLATASPSAPTPVAVAGEPVTPGSTGVAIPAVGLIVAGLLHLLSAVTAINLLGNPHGGWLGNLLGPAASVLPFSNPLFGWSVGLFKAIPAVLMIYGGVQMVQLRSYAWSIAAGILGIVCCSFVGLPMGIWALIVLTKPDVREAFAKPPTRQTPRPGNWGWVWPAAGLLTLLLVCGLVLLTLVAGAGLFSLRQSSRGSGTNSYAAPQDTTETNLTVIAAVIIETPNPGDRQDSSAAAGRPVHPAHGD